MSLTTHPIVPAIGIVGVLLTAGCDDPPLAPTSLPPFTSASETYIRGQVVDTVTRLVPTALVEIVTGPLAGTRRTTDDHARFEFSSNSPAGSTVTLRVSKDGFETTTTTATWQREANANVFWTRLHPLDRSLALGAGDYKLRISIDLATARGFPASLSHPDGVACLGFPTELASRTYDAQITEAPQGERRVSIEGPTVRPSASVFVMWVAGNVAMVDMESFISEEFAGHRYLDIGGGPVPNEFTISADAVHVPFAADFRYCELASARGIYNECSQVPLGSVVRQHWCRSDRVTMTFIKG